MPSPWLNAGRKERESLRAEVYKEELRERAALLYRLNYSAKRAKARLLDNLAWDFEVGSHRAPLETADVEALVDAVYARHGVGAGPLSV